MVWSVRRSWWQSSCLRFFFLDQAVWSGFLCHGHAAALLKELLSSLLQFVSSRLYGAAILGCSSPRILISQSTWFSTCNLLPTEGGGAVSRRRLISRSIMLWTSLLLMVLWQFLPSAFVSTWEKRRIIFWQFFSFLVVVQLAIENIVRGKLNWFMLQMFLELQPKIKNCLLEEYNQKALARIAMSQILLQLQNNNNVMAGNIRKLSFELLSQF